MNLEFRQFKFKTFTNTGVALTPIELKDFIDFEVKRLYYVTDFSAPTGQHCHYKEIEFFICQRGTMIAIIDQGNGKEEISMTAGDAMYVGDHVWHGFKDASADGVLLALSSTNYSLDRSDYLTDYEEYQKLISA